MECQISGNGVSDPILVYTGITSQLSWKDVSLRDCGMLPSPVSVKEKVRMAGLLRLSLKFCCLNYSPVAKQIFLINSGIICWGRTS